MNPHHTRAILLRSLQLIEQRSLVRSSTVAVRCQSTWASSGGKRSRGASASPSQHRRALWSANGKTVPLHINDLQQQQQPQQYHSTEVNKPLREYESDLVVVLDMDECLIHSQFMPGGPGAKLAHQVQQRGSWNSSHSVDTFHISLPDGEQVKVHERPHIHDFLKEVSSKYETHLFTAAMPVYAQPVIQKLDPHGTIFTQCWYRESCEWDEDTGAYVKNLDILRDCLKKTVLVDNNPLSFLSQPHNGILVSSFYNDPNDAALPAVLDMLAELEQASDVRPLLEARFGMERALQKALVELQQKNKAKASQWIKPAKVDQTTTTAAATTSSMPNLAGMNLAAASAS